MKAAGRERALELLAMKSWSKREEGMRMLAVLGERDLMVRHALVESAPAVVHVAVKALHPEPAEVIRHYASMVQGADANLTMQYHVPGHNYLYAEEALIDLYRGRKNKLKPGVIEAIGFAYLRNMGLQFLPRYLKAKPAGSSGTEIAPVLTELGLNAMIAMRRLDHPIDGKALRKVVERFLDAADMGDPYQRRLHAKLEWILFDAGEHDAFEYVAELSQDSDHTGNDIATTLLKRSRFEDLDWFARKNVFCGGGQEFCYWPLINYLEDRGLAEPLPRSHLAFARERGVAPPPWWTWL